MVQMPITSFTICSRDFRIAPLVRDYETAATINKFGMMILPKMNLAVSIVQTLQPSARIKFLVLIAGAM
jgi:hypothetical protein